MNLNLNLTLKSLLPPPDLGWNRVRARCALSTCHNKLLTRAVPQNRNGIHVGQLWYCSPDCFAAGMRSPLQIFATGRIAEMPRNPRLSLGLAMLSRGFLTEEQLRIAMESSRLRGEELEAALIRLGMANEKQLAAARAAQWGYPVLGSEPVSQRVQVNLPATLLRAFSAAPLHYSATTKRLVLGFVYRVEHSLLEAVEQVTGYWTDPCFITPSEFGEQIERVSAAQDYEEAVIETPGNAIHMAKTLGGCAVEVAARVAVVVQCKSWIWARLSGKRKTADVLFALRNTASCVTQKTSPVQDSFGNLG